MEGLTAAYERLEKDRAGVMVERDQLAVAQKELSARSESPNSVFWISRSRRNRSKLRSMNSRRISPRRALFSIEAEAAHAAAAERSGTFVKSVKDQEVALHSAEQKIAMLEARIEELMRSTLGERAVLDERLAKLTKQFEAEAAARSFAEGALHTARQARGAQLHGDDDGSSGGQEPSAKIEPAPGKIAWLRR